MNNKGFTLVELIGSMVILGLLMLVVVPNVVGLMQSNRQTVYIEDAKKLVNIAKSKVSMHKISTLADDQCAFLGLGYLDNSEFDSPPNGGCYDVNSSFVIVKKNGTTHEYEYYVQLAEFYENRYNGILEPTNIKNITKDTIKENEMLTGDNRIDYTKNDPASVATNPPTPPAICASISASNVFNKNGPKSYDTNGEGMCAK